MEAYLLEKGNAKLVTAPVDLNTAAVTGGRVNMKNHDRVGFFVQLGASLAGANVALSLKQHNAATGGTTKELLSDNPYFHKVSTENVFTKVTPSVADDVIDLSAEFDTLGGLIYVEVLAEDLDRDGGFTHVSIDIADAAVAKIGSVLALTQGHKDGLGYSSAI